MEKLQPRDKQGKYTTRRRVYTVIKRTFITLLVIASIYGATFINEAVHEWQATQEALIDLTVQLTDENATLREQIRRVEHETRADEATKWAKSCGDVMVYYLRGQHLDAQVEMNKQGDWLNEIQLDNINY